MVSILGSTTAHLILLASTWVGAHFSCHDDSVVRHGLSGHLADVYEVLGQLDRALQIDMEIGSRLPPSELAFLSQSLGICTIVLNSRGLQLSTVYRLMTDFLNQLGSPEVAQEALRKRLEQRSHYFSPLCFSSLTIEMGLRAFDLYDQLVGLSGSTVEAVSPVVARNKEDLISWQKLRREEALEEVRRQAVEKRMAKRNRKKGSKGKKRRSSRRHYQQQPAIRVGTTTAGGNGSPPVATSGQLGAVEEMIADMNLNQEKDGEAAAVVVEGMPSTKSITVEEEEEEEVCAICTMPLVDDDGELDDINVLICGHRFHGDSCLAPWRGKIIVVVGYLAAIPYCLVIAIYLEGRAFSSPTSLL